MSQELQQPTEDAYKRGLQSEDDLQEILKLALSRGADESGALRARLEMAAAELNIAPAALEEAARLHAEAKEKRQKTEAQALAAKRGFYGHLIPYVVVNAFLLFLDYSDDHAISWAYWPILCWGIGLAIHFATVFILKDYSEYGRQGSRRDDRLDRRLRRSERRRRDDG